MRGLKSMQGAGQNLDKYGQVESWKRSQRTLLKPDIHAPENSAQSRQTWHLKKKPQNTCERLFKRPYSACCSQPLLLPFKRRKRRSERLKRTQNMLINAKVQDLIKLKVLSNRTQKTHEGKWRCKGGIKCLEMLRLKTCHSIAGNDDFCRPSTGQNMTSLTIVIPLVIVEKCWDRKHAST